MQRGKLVFRGKTKKGLPVEIRSVCMADVRPMHAYINELSRERTFITYQGEKVSLAEERAFIKGQLKKIREKKEVQLMVRSHGELIATSAIEMGVRTNRHVGSLGISVKKTFRGSGVGSLLLKIIIEETRRAIPRLEIVTLDVHAPNTLAITLYKKFGFKQYGSLPRGIKLPRGYRDEVFMYKVIK